MRVIARARLAAVVVERVVFVGHPTPRVRPAVVTTKHRRLDNIWDKDQPAHRHLPLPAARARSLILYEPWVESMNFGFFFVASLLDRNSSYLYVVPRLIALPGKFRRHGDCVRNETLFTWLLCIPIALVFTVKHCCSYFSSANKINFQRNVNTLSSHVC